MDPALVQSARLATGSGFAPSGAFSRNAHTDDRPGCGRIVRFVAPCSVKASKEQPSCRTTPPQFDLLAGVRIVDFTQFEAGPSCTEALAWLGADVVKIENPKMGDPGRRLRPGQPDNDPYYFHVFNANKKSITVNLKSPHGLDLVKDMLQQGRRLRRELRPRRDRAAGSRLRRREGDSTRGIIYAQVKGFGEGSPFEQNLAFDMIAQACGGTFSVTGDPDGPPTRPGISLGDTGTGMLMAITILGALFKRARDRRGPAGCRSRCRTRSCTTCGSTSPPRA